VCGVSVVVPPLTPISGLASNHGDVCKIDHVSPVDVEICRLSGAGLAPPTLPVNWGLAGLTVIGTTVAGLTVSVAFGEDPPYLAEMIAVLTDATCFVLILKVAEVSRSWTQTFLGTEAEELLLDMVTRAPPTGAGAERNTSPMTTFPPTTLVGKTPTEDAAAAGEVGDPA
jgi:hypothetical protein